MNLSQLSDQQLLDLYNRDTVVRTAWGEARGEPDVGIQGVGAVIQNRAKSRGLTPAQVALQPNQFEPWGNPKTRQQLEGLRSDDPDYQRIAAVLEPVFNGMDPTGGADHFYAPAAQQALGRAKPTWDNGTGQMIGNHNFLNLEGGNVAPQPQQVAQAPQSDLAALSDEQLLALYNGESFSEPEINYLAEQGVGYGDAPGGLARLQDGFGIPGQSLEIDINRSTHPDFLAWQAENDMIGGSPGYRAARQRELETGRPATFTDQTTAYANDELTGAAAFLGQGGENLLRRLQGGEVDISAPEAYAAARDDVRARQDLYRQESPGLSFLGQVLGGVGAAPAGGVAALPSLTQGVRGAAGLGAGFGALEGEGIDGRLQSAAIGAGAGGILQGVGNRLAASGVRAASPESRRQLAAAAIRDSQSLGIDAIPAMTGSQIEQMAAQRLAGSTVLGGPLRRASERVQGQTEDAANSIISRYGAGAPGETTGRIISNLGAENVQGLDALRSGVAQGVEGVADQFGQGSRRLSGEGVVSGIERFANGRTPGLVDAAVAPARATSFASKSSALYDRVFNRIAREMDGLDAMGASQVRAASSGRLLRDITNRAQSPDVATIIATPEVSRVARAINDPTQSLSFMDLRHLRTWVRQAKKNDAIRQTVGDADLGRLESALTQDIYANADRLASPEAARELRRVDRFYRAGMQRIDDNLSKFYDAPSGEAAFDRIVASASSGGGANIRNLRSLKRSLNNDEWDDVASGVIRQMGGADTFSLDRFISQYDRLSPEGRNVLFGERNASLGKALDGLAKRGRELLRIDPEAPFSAEPSAAFEGVLAAAKSKGRGANVSELQALKDNLGPEEWGEVASSVLQRLGERPAAEGGWSAAQFATQYKGLSEQGRKVLFGGPGREADEEALSTLVRVIERQQQSQRFFNASQSGNVAGDIGMGSALAAAGTVALSGNFVPLATVGGAIGAGRAASSRLASPAVSARRATRALNAGQKRQALARLEYLVARNPALQPYFREAAQAFQPDVPQDRQRVAP